MGEAEGPWLSGPVLDNFTKRLLQIIFIWLQETPFRNLLFKSSNTKFHRCLGIFFLIKNKEAYKLGIYPEFQKGYYDFVFALVAVTQNKKTHNEKRDVFSVGNGMSKSRELFWIIPALPISLEALESWEDRKTLSRKHYLMKSKVVLNICSYSEHPG